MKKVEELLKALPGMLEVEPQESPEAYPETSLYRICYESDGCRVMGYAAFPKELEGPLPCLIFNRGGNREFGALRPGAVCRFAARGFVALGSQYRGNCGGTGQEEFGGADVNDVIRLIDMGLQLPVVQQGGVYMVGHSRGGMMTYLACARDPRIKAAVVGAGLADTFVMYEKREQSMKDVFHELLGGGPTEVPEAFEARCATHWAEKILPPLLICQGTDDWRVAPEQSYVMYDKLKAAGKDCKLLVYEGADHSLQGTTFLDDACQWLRRYPL